MKSVQPNKSPRERREALLEKERASSCTVDSIVGCARCGGTHGQIEFRKLTQPCGDLTHWAPCPTNGEPILMLITPNMAITNTEGADNGQRARGGVRAALEAAAVALADLGACDDPRCRDENCNHALVMVRAALHNKEVSIER